MKLKVGGIYTINPKELNNYSIIYIILNDKDVLATDNLSLNKISNNKFKMSNCCIQENLCFLIQNNFGFVIYKFDDIPIKQINESAYLGQVSDSLLQQLNIKLNT